MNICRLHLAVATSFLKQAGSDGPVPQAKPLQPPAAHQIPEVPKTDFKTTGQQPAFSAPTAAPAPSKSVAVQRPAPAPRQGTSHMVNGEYVSQVPNPRVRKENTYMVNGQLVSKAESDRVNSQMDADRAKRNRESAASMAAFDKRFAAASAQTSGAPKSAPSNTTQPAATPTPPAKTPPDHPYSQFPVFENSGVPSPTMAAVRSSGQDDTDPNGIGKFDSPFMNKLTDAGWNMFGPKMRPQALGTNPFRGHVMNSYIPQQFRNANAAAQYAQRTFKPYEGGMTQGAQLLAQFAPQAANAIDPETLSRVQSALSGVLK